jgi:hypothetical protein
MEKYTGNVKQTGLITSIGYLDFILWTAFYIARNHILCKNFTRVAAPHIKWYRRCSEGTFMGIKYVFDNLRDCFKNNKVRAVEY